jgi:YD repeat-containing protein
MPKRSSAVSHLLPTVILAILAAHAAYAGVTYSYDAAGHLTAADYGSAGVVTYTYDNAGNLISRQVSTGHPSFFNGEVSISGGVYYLQFPDGNLFGYYNYPSSSVIYHYDMGFEGFVAGSPGEIYLYDFTSSHWFYTSNTLFPYLYDFTLETWIYYFPDTKSAGHYTTNPRFFSNLSTGKIFTM